ncbi:MAG: 4-alpha-glucanotransferase, partial [bacterium]|nr:4-alpha-glucanotransferase [bacterium]
SSHRLKAMGFRAKNFYEGIEAEAVPWAMIRLAMMSTGNLCIIPMQDYLGLGDEARMNHPSTLGGNWTWRLQKGQFTAALIKRIRGLTSISARLREE